MIQGLSEKQQDWVCCVSYGRKRDKRIVLLSNMISWEYITVILASCNHWLLFHMLLFTPPLMRKVCPKMVPRLLNDQKEHHMQVCQDIIRHLQTEPDLLRRVITGDETWIIEYELETKHQSCQWKSPMSLRPKKQDGQNRKSKSCWSCSLMSEASSTRVLATGPDAQSASLQRDPLMSEASSTRVLATGPDAQSASLQRDPAAFLASLSAREEMRIVAGQIRAASPRQCTCSQRPEHPAVPGREEHHRAGTTSLFTWPCSVWLFSFPQAQGDHQGDPFWRRGGHQEGRNNGAEGHPRRILPAAHGSVAEKDGKVR